MEVRTAVTSKSNPFPHATGQPVDGAHACESLYRGNEWKFAVSKQRPRQRVSNKRKTWAYLLSIVAVSVVLLACLRASRLRASSSDAGRRLAGRLPENEGIQESPILDMCLDMQEGGSAFSQLLTPVPSSSRAIPLIAEYLFEGISEAGPHPQAGGPLLERVGAAGWKVGGTQALGDGDLDTAAAMGAGTSDACATATFHSPPHPDEEGIPPVSAHVGRALQTLWPLPEEQPGPGYFPETVTGPSSSSPTSEITTTPRREPLPQRSVTTTPYRPGAAQPSLGWKRAVSDPVSTGIAAKLQKEQSAWEGPQPEEYTSDCKRKRLLLPSEPPHLPVDQLPHQVTAEAPEEDPIFSEARRAVPVSSPPPSLEVAEFMGDVRQKIGKQEKDDLSSKATEAVPQESFIPWVELSSSEPESVADKEVPSISPAFVSFTPHPRPPDFGQTLDTSAGVSLARPSCLMPTEASSAQPLSSGDDSGSSPAASASPLPGAAFPLPPTTHPSYRLPVLQPGPITLRFDPERAFSSGNRNVVPFIPFARMHRLLIQPQISPENARALIRHSESLAGRVYYDMQRPNVRPEPKAAVAYLGRLFLFMDLLLSAVQVVGPPMNAPAWLPRLAQVAPSETVFSPQENDREAGRFQAALATRLSSALQILKEGSRLPEKETVSLKKALLCCKYTADEFKRKRWDPWRDDNAGSGGTFVP